MNGDERDGQRVDTPHAVPEPVCSKADVCGDVYCTITVVPTGTRL